jgi:mannose-6-phosphate isomerase-like protein (cupin superfamily)
MSSNLPYASLYMRMIIVYTLFIFEVAQRPDGTVIFNDNDGESVHAFSYLNAIYRIVLRGNQSFKLLTIIEELVYDGDASRCHYHEKEDETIRVLNGTLQVYINGHQFCAPAGTTIYIPRHIKQSHRNLGVKPVHVQLLFSPSGVENYLDEISPVFAQKPVNTSRTSELAKNYGVVHLPDIEWKDLGCAFNSGFPLTQSIRLNIFTEFLCFCLSYLILKQ